MASLMRLMLGYSICTTVMPIVLTDVIQAYHLVGGKEGLFGGVMGMGSVVALLSVMMLEGRVPKQRILILSGLALAITQVILGLPTALLLLLFANFLYGVGAAYLNTNMNSYLLDIHGADAGHHMGALHGAFGIGGLLGPFILQFVLTAWGWRSVYLVAALIILTVVIQFAACRPKYPPGEISKNPKLSPGEIKSYVAERKNLLLLGCAACTQATQIGITTWSVRYISVTLKEPGLGAVALALFWLCATLSRFFVPHLKAEPMKLYVFSILLSGICIVAGIASGNAIVMMGMMAVFGLVGGHTVPLLYTAGAQGFQNRSMLPTTMITITMMTSNMAAPLLMGAVIGISSLQASMYVPALFAGIGALLGWLRMRGVRTK